MLLELSDVEARELKESMETALRSLQEEINHADSHAFRDMLLERHGRLEQLARRLEASLEGDQVYA